MGSSSNDLLSAYCADLASLEYLTEEQQQALLEATQHAPCLDREVRNRLVEAYLTLAKGLAIKRCPYMYRHLLPDIIGEVNLALVLAMERYTVLPESKLSNYMITYIEKNIKAALHQRHIIRIPVTTWQKATQEGAQLLSELQPVSIEAHLQWLEMDGEKISMQHVQPTEAAPERNAEQQAQVDDWLSHLPARDESIVRMYYGLRDEDERTYTVTEIAHMLGLAFDTTHAALERSLLRLKKLAEGTARLRKKDGRLVVKGITPLRSLPTLTPEQVQQLQQTAGHLSAQGKLVTMYALSKASGLSELHTRAFLKQYRQELPQELVAGTAEFLEKREQERVQRIQQIYEQLLAKGKPIRQKPLARAAHVAPTVVRNFLRAREPFLAGSPAYHERREQERLQREQERQLRIQQAYEQLLAKGKPVRQQHLAQVAHVTHVVARDFLRAREQAEAQAANKEGTQ